MTDLPVAKIKKGGKKKISLIGRKFGLLTVVEEAGRNKWKHPLWKCVCDCGKTKIIAGECLRRGDTKSCGCYNVGGWDTTRQRSVCNINTKQRSRHILGVSKLPEYHVWEAMIQRCTNSNTIGYKNYGGRGIIVCQEWLHSFETFFKDMGEKPPGLTIERVNNNGNYEPGNCIWATHTTQMRNRRVSVRNKTGIAGVGFCKKCQKYYVEITADYKTYWLGYYTSIEDAFAARQAGELKYWGIKTNGIL